MSQLVRHLYAGAAIVGAALSLPAQAAGVAAVIDFETVPTNLYFADETFAGGASAALSGYQLTVHDDAAVVDVSPAGTGPSFSDGQFYTQTNEGYLTLSRSDNTTFSLQGFDFAYVPVDPSKPSRTALIAFGTTSTGDTPYVAYLMPDLSGNQFPFGTAQGAPFASMTDLVSVDFFSCPVSGNSLSCSTPLKNNGQFAIDNIQVTGAVPEPSAMLMLAVGVMALTLRARRQAR